MAVSKADLLHLQKAVSTLLREIDGMVNYHLDQEPVSLQEEVHRYESELIRRALRLYNGNQRRAAKLLGVKVTTLNCKIKRFGIEVQKE